MPEEPTPIDLGRIAVEVTMTTDTEPTEKEEEDARR